jgi:hypothetical protein
MALNAARIQAWNDILNYAQYVMAQNLTVPRIEYDANNPAQAVIDLQAGVAAAQAIVDTMTERQAVFNVFVAFIQSQIALEEAQLVESLRAKSPTE